jgi:very-short-patch-repair endonuclease/predicted transcriptional regulator of viral defense system
VSVEVAIVVAMRDDLIPNFGRLAGIVTTAELLATGLSKAEVRSIIRRGVLTPVRRGVHAATGEAADLDGDRRLQIAAAVALVGKCVASHRDAAVIHGLDLLERPPEGVISVIRSRRFGSDADRAGRPGVRIHAVPLPRAHVILQNQIPVTSVPRTVVDVARTTPFRDGVVITDSALRKGMTTKADLRMVIAAMTRWPGIDTARDVVAFADRRAESPFESIARVAFRDGGLPPPRLQEWIGDEWQIIGRVDFLWPEHQTIAEADGALKYADPDRARQQLQRDKELREAGYEVVHITWRELQRAPDQVVASIRGAFARSAALRAASAAAS